MTMTDETTPTTPGWADTPRAQQLLERSAPQPEPVEDDKPIRPTADIRRRLLAGEPLTSVQIIEDYALDRGSLGNVLNELRAANYAIKDEIIPGNGNPKRYTVTSVTPNREAWGKGKNVLPSLRSKRQEGKATTPAKPKAEPKPVAPKAAPRLRGRGLPHPVPQLGSDLAVNALTLTPDGRIAVSIDNGTEQWLCEVIGYSKVPLVVDDEPAT